jgi:hypothetical protein
VFSIRIISTIALVVATVVHTGIAVYSSLELLQLAPATGPHTVARAIAPAVGSRVAGFPDDTLKQAPRSLVLAFRNDCGFCRASLPFYRRMADEVAHSGGAVQLIVASPDEPATTRAYLQENGVAPAAVLQRALDAIGVGGTPTLILSTSEGTVLQRWSGQLAKEAEDEVMHAIRGAPHKGEKG